jgi:hypothetical protein
MAETDNQVSSDGSIVRVVFSGDQTAASISHIAVESAAALDRLEAAGQPMKSLIDMSRIGHVSSAARSAGLEAMADARDAQAAIVGAPPLVRYATQFIIKASGKTPRLRFFKDAPSALAWLAQEK